MTLHPPHAWQEIDRDHRTYTTTVLSHCPACGALMRVEMSLDKDRFASRPADTLYLSRGDINWTPDYPDCVGPPPPVPPHVWRELSRNHARHAVHIVSYCDRCRTTMREEIAKDTHGFPTQPNGRRYARHGQWADDEPDCIGGVTMQSDLSKIIDRADDTERAERRRPKLPPQDFRDEPTHSVTDGLPRGFAKFRADPLTHGPMSIGGIPVEHYRTTMQFLQAAWPYRSGEGGRALHYPLAGGHTLVFLYAPEPNETVTVAHLTQLDPVQCDWLHVTNRREMLDRVAQDGELLTTAEGYAQLYEREKGRLA